MHARAVLRAPADTGAEMDALRQQGPVELSGPAGTVVLWHGSIAHIVGQNHSDGIRVASICDFHKTPASLPDQVLRQRIESKVGEPYPDIWADWSSSVREADDNQPRAARGPISMARL